MSGIPFELWISNLFTQEKQKKIPKVSKGPLNAVVHSIFSNYFEFHFFPSSLGPFCRDHA